MKYPLRVYRDAYLAALDNKPLRDQKRITQRFLSRLVRDRALPSAGRLEKDIRRAHMKRAGRAEIAVESASPLGIHYRRELERIFGARALIQETVNSDLLAGARILVDDELLIDATGRRILNSMFTQRERGEFKRKMQTND